MNHQPSPKVASEKKAIIISLTPNSEQIKVSSPWYDADLSVSHQTVDWLKCQVNHGIWHNGYCSSVTLNSLKHHVSGLKLFSMLSTVKNRLIFRSSFRAAWRMGDATVSRGKCWTNNIKERTSLSNPESLMKASCWRDGERIYLNCPSCSHDSPPPHPHPEQPIWSGDWCEIIVILDAVI